VEQQAQVFFDDDALSKDMSPIFLAIRLEELEILSDMFDFIQNSETREIKNSQHLTPLMYAAKKNKNKVVEMLSLRSKDLDEEDSTHTTILTQFLLEGNFKSARKLVNRGANLNHANSLG
jgi:ankyrin repeat protein